MVENRVYILARELGVSSSTIVKRCQDEGLDVRNHMARVSDSVARQIRGWFSEGANMTNSEDTTQPETRGSRIPSGSARSQLEQVDSFKRILANRGGQAVIIIGSPRTGKSELLHAMLQEARDHHCHAVDQAFVESVVLRPDQAPSAMLITLSGNRSRGRPITTPQEYLKLLRDWVSQSSEKERLVIGVDAEKTLPADSASMWLQVISDLPERVKIVFTQRSNDVLANTDLPNVVRMCVAQSPLPGYSPPPPQQPGGAPSVETDGESQPILGDTLTLGPLTVNWKTLLKRLRRNKKALLPVFLAILLVIASTYRLWIPLVRHASNGGSMDTSLETMTQEQSSPGIITTGPNGPVTVNYAQPDNLPPSLSSRKLLRALKDICDDIDARPLLQREETAKYYVGFQIQRELLSLFNIIEEDADFLLLMVFPGESYVPFSAGWGISCRVRKEAYPELVGARLGSQVYISGAIQEATTNSIMLDKTSLELE